MEDGGWRGVIVALLWGAFAVSSLEARAADPWIEGLARVTRISHARNPVVVDGWAVASCGRVALAFSVDGRTALEGGTSMHSPAIGARFPGVPGSDYAGFSARFDPSTLAPGEHVAMLVARACGLEKELCRVPLTVEPRGSSLVSAGVLLLLGLVSVLLGVWLARFEPGTARWAWTPLVLGAGWLLGVLSILAGSRLGSPEIAPAAAPFAALANWDGNWYLDIARDGYANPRSFAFSPLYPLVLRGLLGLAVPVRLSAALLNGMFFALTAAALRRLYPRRDHALLLFAFLPFSFFFGAVYTEPLLLALAAGALLATLEGEGLAAAALGGLAALTRVTGISTALFAFAALAPRRWRTAALAAAGPVAGLSAWMLWLRFRSGDALSFLHAQGSFGRTVGFDPSLLLDRLVESVSTGGALGRWEVGSLCAVLVGAAGLLWRRRWAEGLYSAAVVLLPLLTQSPTSLNRYALLAFPALVFLGERVSPRVTGFLLVGEAALIVLWATRFGRSVFVG